MADATDYLLHMALGALQGTEKAYDRKWKREDEDALTMRKIKAEEESKMRMIPIESKAKSDVLNATRSSIVGYDENGDPIYKQGITNAPIKPEKTTKKKMLKSQAIEILKNGGDTGDVEIIDDTKGEEKKDTKEQAQKRVSDNLKTMKGLYETLEKGGSIVSTENNALANLGARISSSDIGQKVGGAVGTKSQSIRNQINQIRPLLINDIRQASQMGARGLDSEKELEFYLQSATDPKLDIQTNLNALSVLDNAYGLGIIKSNGLKPLGQSSNTSDQIMFPNDPEKQKRYEQWKIKKWNQ